MEISETHDSHVVNFSRIDTVSPPLSPYNSQTVTHNNNVSESYNIDVPSTSREPSVSIEPASPSSSLPASSRNGRREGRGEREDNYMSGRRSPLNSGVWISFELVVVISQIIAAVIVLAVSRHEKPKTPLFPWVICYTAGCIATLPHLYWRYTHRNNQNTQQGRDRGGERDFTGIRLGGSNNMRTGTSLSIDANVNMNQNNRMSRNTNPRIITLIDHFKMVLDFFFAIWFVVGNIWVFGSRSSPSDAPNLYRLCIVFLTFSCIGYAMPFILCVAICCCLPCIVSISGFRTDINQNRGATNESINALPTYKFKVKKHHRKRDDKSAETNSDGRDIVGILAIGTDKERTISDEDAACRICLAKYVNNDELRELPCTHVFHVSCVDKWLKINSLCPLCKATVEVAITALG